VLRAGDGHLVVVQTAHVGGAFTARSQDDDAVRVSVVDDDHPRLPLPAAAARETHQSELAAVVAAVIEASARADIAPSESPWLPPLPDVLRCEDVLPDGTTAGGWSVPLGLADDPAEQRQVVHSWDPAEGSLGVAGGPRSGRSTALLATALRLAEQHPVDAVHLHVLQGTRGPLDALARLPHVGSVVGAEDPALVRRVIQRLRDQMDVGIGPPRTVVLVDGWESLEESLARIDHGAAVEQLLGLVRDGSRHRLHFVISGGRSLLSGRLPGLLTHRLVLNLPDPVDLTLAGVDPSLGKGLRPPGRAIDVRTGLEVQLALPAPLPAAEATQAAGERWARSSGPDAVRAATPWRIEPLPAAVRLEDLSIPGGMIALGVGGDDGCVVGFAPADGARRILVAGTPRTGTSTALACMTAQLLRSGRAVAVIAARRSPLSGWAAAPRCTVFDPRDADGLVDLRRRQPDLAIVIDGADQLEGSPIERALVESAQLATDTDGLVVVGTDLARSAVSFRGLVPEVARDGCGVILGATAPTDGDVLGVRLDTTGDRRPGRGFLVSAHGSIPVQVALPPAPDEPSGDAAANAGGGHDPADM